MPALSSSLLEPRMASDQFVLLRPKEYQGEFLRVTLDLREDKTYVEEVFYASDMSFSNGGWSLLDDRLRLMDALRGSSPTPSPLVLLGGVVGKRLNREWRLMGAYLRG